MKVDGADLGKLTILAGKGLGMSDDISVFSIDCRYGFEPNGRASEDWEYYFVVTLPRIRYHYKTIIGWTEGKGNMPMTFKDKNVVNAVHRAILFLEWYNYERTK